jgi:hypothetical protein
VFRFLIAKWFKFKAAVIFSYDHRKMSVTYTDVKGLECIRHVYVKYVEYGTPKHLTYHEVVEEYCNRNDMSRNEFLEDYVLLNYQYDEENPFIRILYEYVKYKSRKPTITYNNDDLLIMLKRGWVKEDNGVPVIGCTICGSAAKYFDRNNEDVYYCSKECAN